jgi:late competence protein required for DNA uptake (superfamily II DNA/RNA helicase)
MTDKERVKLFKLPFYTGFILKRRKKGICKRCKNEDMLYQLGLFILSRSTPSYTDYYFCEGCIVRALMNENTLFEEIREFIKKKEGQNGNNKRNNN